MNEALIKQAFDKRAEIKAKKAELDAMDKEIVDWLDKELEVFKDTGVTQMFQGSDFRVTAQVPQNWKCDEVKVTEIMNNNPELQLYADSFTYKMAVKDGAWNKVPEEIRKAFEGAVTSAPGKTQYQIKFN